MLEPVPDPGPLLLRPRVGRWAAEGAATRVWLLQAGPGSGKAATARLLARALGKTAFYLEPGKQVPEQLAAWLDLPGGAAPERIAEALAIRLDRDAGGKAALVLSRADEASRAGTRAERFLRHWIAIADNRTVTIATARIPLDWLPVRAIAAGEVRILSAPDLWFDPDEALQVAPDLAGSPQTLQATCGWPLALAAAVRHAGRTGLRALLEDLATAELLNRLPSDLRDAALWLSPVGRFAPDDDPPGDPDHAAALGWLVRWGALVPGADGMAVWHPLLRRALREGQGANSAPAKRREGVARLGRWLERRDPARAFDFWLAEGEMDPAIATMVRLASPIPVSEATDRLLFGWLDRLPVQVREADPSVLLVEGTLLLRRGTLAGARDLLVAAHAGFADRGDLEGRFTALGRLLAVELQCEDAAGARKWATEAEALEPAGELGDRVVYHVNRGNLAFLERDEDLAMAHFRRALDFPHLGRARAALAQQEGCINLAILCYERGEYGQARRTLARALALHEAHPIDTFFPVRAALHLTLCALGLGDHAAAAALLGRLPAGSRSTNAYLDAVARRMEGHALLLLGQVSEADTKLRGALDAFAAQGVERTSDAAATLVLLAEAARRRKELDAGQILLDWAAPLAGPFPRLKANLALCRGLLHRDAGRLAEARAAFSDGEATLGSLCARPLAATLALCAAATAEELGDRGA
ncbi:MAG: hypothetical protein FJZ00_01490, partial [Candidatus Sericytochromatia bacterium]|nr:hypothetical protein [Candidatus Tanganyikabacteria bacterium]